jgi:hypothetical protein
VRNVRPKVREADPPYRIIDRPLFALLWLAIVGAVFAPRRRCSDRSIARDTSRTRPEG